MTDGNEQEQSKEATLNRMLAIFVYTMTRVEGEDDRAAGKEVSENVAVSVFAAVLVARACGEKDPRAFLIESVDEALKQVPEDADVAMADVRDLIGAFQEDLIGELTGKPADA